MFLNSSMAFFDKLITNIVMYLVERLKSYDNSYGSDGAFTLLKREKIEVICGSQKRS